MKRQLALLAGILIAAFSQAIAIGPIGGGGGNGGGDGDCVPVSANLYVNEMVTMTSQVNPFSGIDEVHLEILTVDESMVAEFDLVPDVNGQVSVTWFPPVDQSYVIKAHGYSNGIEVSCETVALIQAVRPDSHGFITGGGWYKQNVGKDTFGFVAQVLGNGNIKGNFEFQDHENLFNFKSTSIDWVYSPDCVEGFFSGFCKLNGGGNYRFFVHVFDNGEPGNNDTLEFRVYDPVSGALIYDYSQTLSHGNIQIHCR
ncbi:MAG: hypothetical protein KDC26_04410 [Armatimonadetes bacterium]|nr:hypothetical protein [Armatimonadota bacterium]